jgi:hypothetical protein
MRREILRKVHPGSNMAVLGWVQMVNLLNFKWQKDLRKKDDEESRGLRWSIDLQSLAADAKLR